MMTFRLRALEADAADDDGLSMPGVFFGLTIVPGLSFILLRTSKRDAELLGGTPPSGTALLYSQNSAISSISS